MSRIIYLLIFIFTLSSCNLYDPFSSGDLLEQALRCLHQRDFDCAIEKYNQLPDGDVKREKLCLANLSKAGFDFNTMLEVATESSATMMGSLANALAPWNSTKAAGALAGSTACNDFATQAPTNNTAVLLTALAQMGECATRMARSDLYQTTNETNCDATASPDGTVTQSDVGGDAVGVVSVPNPGMCADDVQGCATAMARIAAAEASLRAAGLDDLADAFALVDPVIWTGGTDQLKRAAVKGTLSTR